MAQNISLMGASYPNVPSVRLPKTGGGQATFVDVTGASLSSSDGSKILTGQTAYGNDGGLINGSMPDYTTFPLYSMHVAKHVITPASDARTLTIPAMPECTRPVQLVVAIARTPANLNSIYADASTAPSHSTLFCIYDRNMNIFSTSLTKSSHLLTMVKARYYTSGSSVRRAYMDIGQSQTTAYSEFLNESAIKTGGAYLSTPQSLFRKNVSYCVLVGW